MSREIAARIQISARLDGRAGDRLQNASGNAFSVDELRIFTRASGCPDFVLAGSTRLGFLLDAHGIEDARVCAMDDEALDAFGVFVLAPE